MLSTRQTQRITGLAAALSCYARRDFTETRYNLYGFISYKELPPMLCALINTITPTRNKFTDHFLALALFDISKNELGRLEYRPNYLNRSINLPIECLLDWLTKDTDDAVRLVDLVAAWDFNVHFELRKVLNQSYAQRCESFYNAVLNALKSECVGGRTLNQILNS